MRIKSKSGFTLIELIVVIAIIGVLAAILIPIMMGYVTNSRIQSLNVMAREIREEINLWAAEQDARGGFLRRNADTSAVFTVTDGDWSAVSEAMSGDANAIDALLFVDPPGGAYDLAATLAFRLQDVRTATVMVVMEEGIVQAVAVTSGVAFPDGFAYDPDDNARWVATGGARRDGIIGGVTVGTNPPHMHQG